MSFLPGIMARVLSPRLKGSIEVRVRVERKNSFFPVADFLSNSVTHLDVSGLLSLIL